MELKVKASKKAIKALEDFMFDSKYEYECKEYNERSENDKVEQAFADIRKNLEDKFAKAEEDGKEVLGCELKIKLITINKEDDTPFDSIVEIAKSAYNNNDLETLTKIAELAKETLEDEED